MRTFIFVGFAVMALVTPVAMAGTTTRPADAPASQPATKPAAQDGPGVYRASAGPNGKFTATFRAKSREDAINIALKTVGQKAMDNDENVDIGQIKVVRIGD